MITKSEVDSAYDLYMKNALELRKAIFARNWALCGELSPIVDGLEQDYQSLLNKYRSQTVTLPEITVELYLLVVFNRDYSFIQTTIIEDLDEDVRMYLEDLDLGFSAMPLKELCKEIRNVDDLFCNVLAYTLDTEDSGDRILHSY